MANLIKVKRGIGVPSALESGELALDTSTGDLYGGLENSVSCLNFRGLLSNSKAFIARNGTSTKSIAANGWVEVTGGLFTNDYDSKNWHNTSTGRFQPTEEGLYLVGGGLVFQSFEDGKKLIVALYKNGTLHTILARGVAGGSDYMGLSGNVIVEMNGTTDYCTLAVYHNCSSSKTLQGTNYCFYQGLKLEVGEQGPQGIQGIQGIQGEKGDDGAVGSDANVTKANVEAVLTGEITSHTHPSSGGDSKAYGSFYLTTGGRTALSNTAVQLYLNTEGAKTSELSLASNAVTVNKTGAFSIDVHVYLNNSSTARTEYSMWLRKNGTEIAGTRFASYQRGYDSGMSSGTSLIENLTSGDTIDIMCQRTDGSATAGYQDANGTRLNIKEI